MSIVIKGTGSFLPEKIVPNSAFEKNTFYAKTGDLIEKPTKDVIASLEAITGIKERRYIPDNEDSVPLMVKSALNAIKDSGLDKDELGGIIVAHNAGNMVSEMGGWEPIPNMAGRIKNSLNITNHNIFAYDILFGCPGWLQAIIQARQNILTGDADNILVVGIEVASRMLDPHDVDSMIFADGCGAAVISSSDIEGKGILGTAVFSHGLEDLMNIYVGKSNNKEFPGNCFLKMKGRDVYRYATKWLPQVIKKALDKSGHTIKDIDIFLFHQANEKMLHAIAANISKLYGIEDLSFDGKIPMTIQFTGNTSVATIPNMLDMILKGKLDGYNIKEGDLAVLASVGVGMHCNAIVYQF